MGEHDEAGRAEALPPPPLEPPPPVVLLLDFLLPPHPAATSARITAMAASPPRNSRLFTLPPPSRMGHAERASATPWPEVSDYPQPDSNPKAALRPQTPEDAAFGPPSFSVEEPMVPPRAPSLGRSPSASLGEDGPSPPPPPGYDAPGRSG